MEEVWRQAGEPVEPKVTAARKNNNQIQDFQGVEVFWQCVGSCSEAKIRGRKSGRSEQPFYLQRDQLGQALERYLGQRRDEVTVETPVLHDQRVSKKESAVLEALVKSKEERLI